MYTSVAVVIGLLMQVAPPQPQVDQEAKTKAQVLLKEGTALFEQGDPGAALEKFEAAFAVFPSPKLQFNIGQANRDLGRPVEALRAFEKFLSEAPDASSEARADARKSVADLKARLGRLEIECGTTGVEVTVDGKPVGLTPLAAPVWTTPGRHQVTGRRAQFTPAIEDVDVTEGRLRAVNLHMRLAAGALNPPIAQRPATVSAAPSAPAISTSPEAAPVEHPSYRNLFWAGVAATAVLGLGAVVYGLAADSAFSNLQGSCGKTSAGCTESQIDFVKNRVVLTNVLWALAGTTAAATGVVFYLDNRETGVAWRF